MPSCDVSLDVIQIKEPCHVPWDAMVGDDVQRYCAQCKCQVHNLAQMRRRDAEALVSRVGHGDRGERVCVQMQRRADGRVMTREDVVGHRRFARRAGAISRQMRWVLVGLAAAVGLVLFWLGRSQEAGEEIAPAVGSVTARSSEPKVVQPEPHMTIGMASYFPEDVETSPSDLTPSAEHSLRGRIVVGESTAQHGEDNAMSAD